MPMISDFLFQKLLEFYKSNTQFLGDFSWHIEYSLSDAGVRAPNEGA